MKIDITLKIYVKNILKIAYTNKSALYDNTNTFVC